LFTLLLYPKEIIMNEIIKIDERIENVMKVIEEMEDAFLEIQQPRTAYVIEKFVVGQHDTVETQYAQCVLEMQIKYDNLRRAKLNKRKVEIKIKDFEDKGTELDQIEADLMRIDLEEQDRAVLGALREFEALYKIWQSFPKKFNRAELDAGQENYWRLRLARQAQQDLQATGRIGVGNNEALRQIGLTGDPQLDHVREIEKKYLEIGDVKVLICVPTREKAEKLPVLENLTIPSGVQVKFLNVYGRTTAEAYNEAIQTALDDKADFLLTVEDDTFPPNDGFQKLISKYREINDPKVVLGGYYVKKTPYTEGVHIRVSGGKRQALTLSSTDTGLYEVYTIAQGFTLFPMEAFLQAEYPWTVTTAHLTQDSFLSQKLRDKGFRLLVDASIRCKHLDVSTGKYYE
jgi:hypothetical protein